MAATGAQEGDEADVRPAAEPKRTPFTADDLLVPQGTNRWRRLPTLTVGALTLVWQAAGRKFVAATFFQLAAGVGLGAQLLIMRRLLNDVVAVGQGESTTRLLPVFIVFVAVLLLLSVFSALAAHNQRFVQELVGIRTFDRIIDTSSSVDLQVFETPGFHDQLERARTSGMYRPIEMVNSVSTLTTGLLTSLGVGAALFVMQPVLLGLVAVAAIPVLVATLANSRANYEFEYSMTPHNRERMYIMELLTDLEPAKEIRVFDATRHLRARYDDLTRARVMWLRRFLRRRLRVTFVGALAGASATALSLGSLGLLLVHGHINVATALTAGLAMQLLSARLTSMIGGLGQLVESGMFLDDYNAFVALKPDIPPEEPEEGLPPIPPFEGLVVEGASFSYPGTDRLVLDDVDLRIDPGQVVALVGENGSGKTTLIKLICQLYRPDSGRVLWNGEDASRLDVVDVRSEMTVIFQDFVKYHLSASDNITLGRVSRAAGLEQIREAARQSGADSFLSTLPSGYDTRLGREFYGGYELSIGQWQRLALARAFFRGGGFLVLDEPTAALDPRSEHELFSQMRALAHGRSVLLVSHRFSSVRTADVIYVLHGGRVIESGSHQELVARDGHYAELFRLQTAAYLGE